MSEFVDITKLKKNTILIIDTSEQIYEAEVINPKKCEVWIIGGPEFIEPSTAIIGHEIIKPGMNMILRYKKKKQRKFRMKETGAIISIRILTPDWEYTLESTS